jgi:hypothetical protein
LCRAYGGSVPAVPTPDDYEVELVHNCLTLASLKAKSLTSIVEICIAYSHYPRAFLGLSTRK